MELAPKIRQRLGVARFWPECAGYALARDRGVTGMKDEEGDELLLTCVRWAGSVAAVGQHAEAAKQLDPESRRTSHLTSLLRPQGHQRIDPGRFLCRK